MNDTIKKVRRNQRPADFSTLKIQRIAASASRGLHGQGGINHAIGEAPFVVIPGHDFNQAPVDTGVVGIKG